jgi:hypothetical protein
MADGDQGKEIGFHTHHVGETLADEVSSEALDFWNKLPGVDINV